MVFHIEGVVHILGRGAVYGDKGTIGQIFTGQIIGFSLPLLGLFRCGAWQIMTTQHDPPGRFGIIAAGDALADLGKVGTIVQGVALEIGNDPVAFTEEFLIQPLDGTGLDDLLQDRMVRNHIQTILDKLDASDKAAQKGSDQGIRLGLFFLVFRADQHADPVTMHHLFHLHGRNEIALAVIRFQKAEATVRAANYALFFWNVIPELLFELRQQRIVLKHRGYPVEESCRLYELVMTKPRKTLVGSRKSTSFQQASGQGGKLLP